MVVHVFPAAKNAALHLPRDIVTKSGCRPCGDGNDEFAPWINWIFCSSKGRYRPTGLPWPSPWVFQGVNLGGTSWKSASLGSFLLRLVGARSPPKNQGLNNKGSQVLISPKKNYVTFGGRGVATARFGVRFFLQMGC